MTLFRQMALRTLVASLILACLILLLSGNWLANNLIVQQQQESRQQFETMQRLIQPGQGEARLPKQFLTLSKIKLVEKASSYEAPIGTTLSIDMGLLQPWLRFVDIELQRQWRNATGESVYLTAVSSGDHYRQIWLQRMYVLALVLGFFASLMLTILLLNLRKQLAPLRQVSNHVEALANMVFLPPLSSAKSFELQNITTAVNTLTKKLQWEMSRYRKQVDELKHELLTDSISDLPNRTYIVEQLDSWLRQADAGILAMINLKFLEQVRQLRGFEYRDQLITRFSRKITALNSRYPGLMAARISAEEFVVVISEQEGAETVNAISELVADVHQQSGVEMSAEMPVPYGIGVVVKQGQNKAEHILAQADQALLQALLQDNYLFWSELNDERPTFRTEWRSDIEQALRRHRFRFVACPVVDAAGDRIQLDLDCKLEVAERWLSERELWPHLKLSNQCIEFEKAKIRAATQLDRVYTPVVFKLAQSCIDDTKFVIWLAQLLREKVFHFQFEVSERQVITSPESVGQIREMLRNLGYRFGVNHFGINQADLNYISWLRPDYVKLDPAFCATPHSPLLKQTCTALLNALQTMNVEAFVMEIPNEEALRQFASMPYNGFSRLGEVMPITGYKEHSPAVG